MNAVSMLALAVAVAGCSAREFQAPPNDAGAGDLHPTSDTPCPAALTFTPFTPPPIAGPSTTIRVQARLGRVSGVPTYSWLVRLNGLEVGTTYAQADHSEIDFVATDPGVYDVRLNLGLADCPILALPVNVGASRARSARVRLRVVPPQSAAAPPLEQQLVVHGGAALEVGAIAVPRGMTASAQVVGPNGDMPAFVRFSPAGAPDAVVEAFTDGAGQVAAQLSPDLQAVLIVPADATLAPGRVASWSPGSPVLVLGAGSPLTGTVRDPDNAVLAGATVQLTVDGVPSTVATTAADGGFTLRAALGGGPVTVTVTPPAASGLPRLSATSQTFTFGAPLEVRYASGLVRRDLAGLRVQRVAPIAGARLVIVGKLADAGTVTAGTTATAAGEVRIAVTADGAGRLPPARVPAAALSAVITVTPGDLAVVALDTTTAVPASLEAPAMQSTATAARDVDGVGLPGAVLDLVPTRELEMAAAPPVHVVAGALGAITVVLPSGGTYDLRLHDPARRAASLVVLDRAVIDPSYLLPHALELRGTLLLDGVQALANASVQLLCEDCTGIERAKPIAEGASDETGRFQLAVPDPGNM